MVILFSKLKCHVPTSFGISRGSYISVSVCVLWTLSFSFGKLGKKLGYQREDGGYPIPPLLHRP